MYKQFEEIDAEFESKYGYLIHDRTAGGTSDQGAHSKEEDRKVRKYSTQSSVNGKRRLRRLKRALFTGPLFQKQLEALEKSVDLLYVLSEKRFVEHVCAYRDTDWKGRVEHTKTRGCLVHSASQSTIASRALRDLVEASNDYNVDFYLGHGASPDGRQQFLLECTRKAP